MGAQLVEKLLSKSYHKRFTKRENVLIQSIKSFLVLNNSLTDGLNDRMEDTLIKFQMILAWKAYKPCWNPKP